MMFSNNGSKKPVNAIANTANTPLLNKQGSVISITMGDKTFDVLDPSTMDQFQRIINNLSKSVHQTNSVVNQLTYAVNVLKQENISLKHQIELLKREVKNNTVYGRNDDTTSL